MTTKIKLGLFFDGTLNNGFNATALNKQNYSSYTDGTPTNIFILYENYKREAIKNNHNNIAIYVEGIGTLTNQGDSTIESGLGNLNLVGHYGGPAKIQFALERIHQELSWLLDNADLAFDKEIELEFNIFGFSRGAALARTFCNGLQKKSSEVYEKIKESLSLKNKSSSTMSINFVGLFDTVESFQFSGINTDIKGSARCVYQLSALNECRANYPLTSILNEKNQGNRNESGTGSGYFKEGDHEYIELCVPGSHADVGGGYKSHTDENNLITCTYFRNQSQAQVNFLKAHSDWQDTLNSVKEIPILTSPPYFYCYANFKRLDIKNDLSLIYASLMADAAVKRGCDFNIDQLKQKTKNLPTDLKDFEITINKISDSISSEAFQSFTPFLKNLHKFIHITVNYDAFFFAPDTANNNEWRRKIIYGSN